MKKDVISLVEGKDAKNLLANNQFNIQWNNLFKDCTWSTVNQHPHFVSSWYHTYEEEFTPLIIWQASTESHSGAIFTLATNKLTGELVIAGMPQIDYASWLCSAEYSDEFSVEAFRLLAAQNPRSALHFRYVIKGLPMQWVDSAHKWKGHVETQEFSRPAMSLANPAELEKALRKKSNKSRYNRLKKMGEVEILKITTREELSKWIDEIALFCDLRQGAINGSKPFYEDACKRDFHLDLMNSDDILYCTLMLVGGQFAAAIISLCSGKSAAIGLFALSPFFTKHSPGKMLIYETGLLLARDGYSEFDLTPGDEWKERFASEPDTVNKIFVHFGQSNKIRLRASIKATCTKILQSIGVSPTKASGFLTKLRGASLGQIFRKLSHIKAWVWHTVEVRLYVMPAAEVVNNKQEKAMSVGKLSDLLAFVPRDAWQSTSNFLGECLSELSNGAHLYSCADEGVLMHCGWLGINQPSSRFSEIGVTYEYPENSAVAFSFYTDPTARGRGLYQKSLRQILTDAVSTYNVKQIYISVNARNTPSRHVIEKVGFNYEESLFRRTFFGYTSTFKRGKDANSR